MINSNHLNKFEIKNVLLEKLNSISQFQAEQESQIIISYSAKKENYLDVNNSEIDEKLIRQILNERINGKPLAKIINEKGFWNKIFYTDEHTLDPRADSEIMVEQLLIDCKKLINKEKLRFLDLCCGTGCLGISIIDDLDDSFCDFIDISEQALAACKKNIIKFKQQKKTKIFHSNLFENYPINRLKNIDIIVCNPPYIPTIDYLNLNKETLHDPRISLDGGKLGMDYYVKIINFLICVKFKGVIYFEIDPIITKNMYKFLLEKGVKIVYKKTDYLNLDRLIKIKFPIL
tara:strand:- start:624 stop:1490 length:867 start_codon:yes stop_codon:yes gene_type:complete